MGGCMCWQVFMYQGASGCTCLAIKMSLCACVCGWYVCGVYVLECVCICVRVSGVHAGEPTCSSGLREPMLVGGRGRAECGSWRGHTFPFPWHSLKTTTVSQCEFFVAKINFLI